MKKIVLFVLLATALRGGADVITNHVYVVSNVFYHVYHENVVTQKVKNTHYNYYYTNYVSVVTNIYETTWRTNMSVSCDIGAQFLVAASNEANRAGSYVGTTEGLVAAAASNSTAAASSASSAAAAATAAQNSRTSAASECAAALDQINARINWFDQHSGETITMVNITTNVDIHVDTYGHPYVSPDGVTTNANFIYYPIAHENGKVAITTIGNYKPSVEYRFVPAYGGSSNQNYWDLEPGYVDSDANGMRLHYLPKATNTVEATTYNAGDNYIPRDFYWQNGVVYAVIDSFNGRSWRGRIKMSNRLDSPYVYPNGIGDSEADESQLREPWYQRMIFVSREGSIMGTSTSQSISVSYGWFKTRRNSVLPSSDSILWFPEKPSPTQQTIIDWLNSYTR